MLEMQTSIGHHIDTGPSQLGNGLSRVFIALPLAAVGYFVFQNVNAPELVTRWPSVAFLAVCLALMTVTPWYPAVGLFTFVAASYGAPLSNEASTELLGVNVLNWLCALAMLGWIVGSVRLRIKPRNPGLLIWPFVAFIIWQSVCGVLMVTRGNEWSPHPNHHPELYAQAFVLFLLAGQLLRSPDDCVRFAIVLGASLCIRWALAGNQGIHLEGDIPALGVVAIPVLFIGMKATWSGVVKLLLFGGVVALIVLIFTTNNRNAVVAFVILLPALWLTAKQKLPIFILSLPVVIIAGIVFAQSSNWKQFEAFVTGGNDINSANSRLLSWQSAWNMSLANPLFGVGPGNFHNEVANYPLKDGTSLQLDETNNSGMIADGFSAHNSVIHTLGETGFIGAGLYLILFGCAATLSLFSRPPKDALGKTDDGWPFPALKLLFAAVAAYMAIGIFLSRQDLVLAYLLVGWVSAVHAKNRTACRRSTANSNNPTVA